MCIRDSSGSPLLALRLALAVALRVFRVGAEVTAAASPGEAKARRNRVWLCRVSVSPRGHAMSARAGPTATSRVECWLMTELRTWLPDVSGSSAARAGSAYGRDQRVCLGAAALSRAQAHSLVPPVCRS